MASDNGRLKLLDWRRQRQGTLRGFASIRLDPPGLVIHDLHVHKSGETCYALLPGKPQVSQAGQVLLDDRGKRKYTPIVEIPDRDVRDRISTAVVVLVKAREPEALAS